MQNTSADYITTAQLQVQRCLFDFVEQDLLAKLEISSADFWQGLNQLITEFMPRNQALLATREHLQQQIDQWHLEHRTATFDFAAYKDFLQQIGYLSPNGDDFTITTNNVDPEIAIQAGPQLVVPVMNARFALNACNARWGSLYDALYGTDVIPESDGADKGRDYNPVRGAKVIAYGREFLNKHFPLQQGDYLSVTGFTVENQSLSILQGEQETQLADGSQWLGYSGAAESPTSVFLSNHGLQIEIQIDADSVIGANDKANIKDIVLESALTTIMDCEDSVAAVDGEDKVVVYRNWLGLMRGDLTETVTKNGKTFERVMAADKTLTSSRGESMQLSGRSLMFVRNVGHLMTTPAVLTAQGKEIPEGILDALVTTAAALYDLKSLSPLKNSATGSVYIVKPKMHGPEEVAFSDELFTAVERILGLPQDTVKIGIMDEERRTSVNLSECIRAAKGRVAFINTGFLDRTGDEIHTSMEAGAFAGKAAIKNMVWIKAYELNNVATGLACGLHGKAQIGKGMWAMPDNMADMMTSKIAQPKAGANTAWVPSPTAATLHVMHYHEVDVAQEQRALLEHSADTQQYLDDILSIPLLGDETLDSETITQELENNAQGILGYVVRWIDQGIGCSKVPDIHNTPLMEDRATLRISSQHICNWLHHDICTEEQVLKVLTSMAKVVDQQNAHDPLYKPLSDDLENNIAFRAAKDLIFKGRTQPSGYTEPLLHAYRLQLKSSKLLPDFFIFRINT